MNSRTHRIALRPAWPLLVALFLPAFACIADNSARAPMDIKNFRPYQAYAAVHKFAGPGALLKSIKARYVRSDGTMDLRADYKPTLTYKFVRPHPDTAKLPIGAGAGESFQEVPVTIAAPHFGAHAHRNKLATHPAYFRSMKRKQDWSRRKRGAVIGPPRCKLTEMWNQARTAGAPAKAVALINYTAAGYEFRIQDTRVRLYFDDECNPIDRREHRTRQVESRRR